MDILDEIVGVGAVGRLWSTSGTCRLTLPRHPSQGLVSRRIRDDHEH